jgi:hypothetical protein
VPAALGPNTSLGNRDGPPGDSRKCPARSALRVAVPFSLRGRPQGTQCVAVARNNGDGAGNTMALQDLLQRSNVLPKDMFLLRRCSPAPVPKPRWSCRQASIARSCGRAVTRRPRTSKMVLVGMDTRVMDRSLRLVAEIDFCQICARQALAWVKIKNPNAPAATRIIER